MHSMVAAKLATHSHSSPAPMAIQIPPPRKWSHKHIVLVALIGSLVVNAITAAIFISIAPAHISFSIQNPTIGNKADDDTKYYNFTLVVNNSSPHMAVHYGELSAEVWYREAAWVPAVIDRSSLLDDGTTQPPGNVTHINVSAEYWKSEQLSTPAEGNSGEKAGSPPPPPAEEHWSNCTVLVTGRVWFKSKGWISTRWYDVSANCSQVNFNKNNTMVECKG